MPRIERRKYFVLGIVLIAISTAIMVQYLIRAAIAEFPEEMLVEKKNWVIFIIHAVLGMTGFHYFGKARKKNNGNQRNE